MLQRTAAAFIILSVSALAQNEDARNKLYAEVAAALALKSGAVVADIGSGDDPRHALRIASAVGSTGRVVCVDVNQNTLDRLKSKLPAGTHNIETHLGRSDNPMLSPASFDAVLVSNSYHEMTEHKAMLAHILAGLKPDGRLVVIESIHPSRRQAEREQQVKHHELSPEIVEAELKAAGFEVLDRKQVDTRSGNEARFLISAQAPRDRTD